MASYSYRCASCGEFEVRAAMGRAPGSVACPHCATDARRVYTAPAVSRTPDTLARARTAEERSRDAPKVVTSLPPRRRRTVAARDPRHATLPRW